MGRESHKAKMERLEESLTKEDVEAAAQLADLVPGRVELAYLYLAAERAQTDVWANLNASQQKTYDWMVDTIGREMADKYKDQMIAEREARKKERDERAAR